MPFPTLLRGFPSTAAITATLLLAACAGSDTSLAPGTQPAPQGEPAPVSVALAMSPVNGAGRVAIALRVRGDAPVAGVQVALTFDTQVMTYEGLQIAERPSAVAQARAAGGLIRVLAVAPREGIRDDAAVLLFSVREAGAASTVRLVAASGEAVVAPAEPRPVRLARGAPRVDSTLVARTAVTLTATEWAARLDWPMPSTNRVQMLSLPSGRIYGDPTGDGLVSVQDVVFTSNVAVGLRTPTATEFEAANVAPTNLADGVEADLPDPCRPGRACTGTTPFSETGPGVISVLDVVLQSNEAVGLDQPVAGRAIPVGAGAVNGVVSSAVTGALSGVVVTATPGPPPSNASSATTSATGAYTLLALPGNATLRLSGLPSNCTDPGPQPVTVTQDAATTLNIAVSCVLPPLVLSAVEPAPTGIIGNWLDITGRVKLSQGGVGVANTAVTFSLQGSGGAVVRTSAVTDSAGFASPGAWRLSAAAGVQTLVATSGSASVQLPATASAAPAQGFSMTLRFAGTATASQQAIAAAAAVRWTNLVRGDLPDAQLTHAADAACFPIPIDEMVDDVLIIINVVPIDGVGTVLGRAGPCILRQQGALPIEGLIEIDEADAAALESSGRLGDVIAHEMGHVLGIGTLWQTFSLLEGAGTADPGYLGTRGRIGAAVVSGGTLAEARVAVENVGTAGSIDSHWRESVFDNELMTSRTEAAGIPNVLSYLSALALRDLGYLVDDRLSEPYTLPAPGSVAPLRRAGEVDLIELPPPVVWRRRLR